MKTVVLHTGKYPLTALDLENNMYLQNAERYVTTAHEKTNHWLLVYRSAYLKNLVKGHKKTILTKCSLWLTE
ncbi:MAG: hypothetical protein ABI045_05490 [Flavobacteriales bacterium]